MTEVDEHRVLVDLVSLAENNFKYNKKLQYKKEHQELSPLSHLTSFVSDEKK